MNAPPAGEARAAGSGGPPATDGPSSHLPHTLALLYALAIAYASLQPFGDWIPPPADAPFWLFSPGRARWLRFDVAANVIANSGIAGLSCATSQRARSASPTSPRMP